jgi:hypothetical protein
VEWIVDTNNVPNLGLNPSDGTLQGSTQTSTLPLSSKQLEMLKTAGGDNPAHKFTCKIAVGNSKTEFTAIQTLTINAPGKRFTNKVYK